MTTAPALSEAQFQRRVIDWAELRNWMCCHVRPARTAKGWRTPLEGDPGMPDLILARRGVVLLAELKAERGRVSVDQSAWLAALGGHGRLWRPTDWPTIMEELR